MSDAPPDLDPLKLADLVAFAIKPTSTRLLKYDALRPVVTSYIDNVLRLKSTITFTCYAAYMAGHNQRMICKAEHDIAGDVFCDEITGDDHPKQSEIEARYVMLMIKSEHDDRELISSDKERFDVDHIEAPPSNQRLLSDDGWPDYEQRKAVWIASYPISGNTWVRVFINNLMTELYGEDEGASGINSLKDWTTWENEGWRFLRRMGIGDYLTPAKIAGVRAQVQSDLVREQSERRTAAGKVYIKTHNAVATNVEGFYTINWAVTNAVIYILRNPLDVAISYAHHCGMPVDLIIRSMSNPAAHADTWNITQVYDFMGSWSFHVDSWTSITHRPVWVMRYEDMVADPEHYFGGLATFLGLKPTQEQLRRAVERSSFVELSRQEAKHGFIECPVTAEKFFRVGKAGQWKEVLSQDQINAVVSAHGSIMRRWGYLEA